MPAPFPIGFILMACNLIFGNRLERLVEPLIDRDLQATSPFEPELIIVSGTGMRRWLCFQMARRRGVLANCHFPTLFTFIQELLGNTLDEKEDPAYSVGAMIPKLFAALKQIRAEPSSAFAIPAGYLRNQSDAVILQMARRMADLFDQYLTYRPDWIQAWEKDRRVLHQGDPCHQHEEWQRCLWQQLFANSGKNRVHLYHELRDRLLQGPVDSLPPQLTVFGTHTLPPVFLEIFKALGTHHQVDLLIPQPTPAYWGDQTKQQLAANTPTAQVDEPLSHPLLASWGAQGRDLFNLLIDKDLYTAESDDHYFFAEPEGQTLLATVQRSLFQLQPTLPPTRPDDSLLIHCCHHPLRELEVLRDQLLFFFKQNPGLRPDDVLVLAPDMQTYSPLIEAVFRHSEEGQPELPFAVADREFHLASRVVDTFYRLLQLGQSRLTAPEVFALFQSPPVRKRFGWQENDLQRIRNWLLAAGAIWGRDADHRAELGLPAISAYSWDEALQRLFLGYAVRPAEPSATIADPEAPCDVLEGQDSNLLASLAEAWNLLRNASRNLQGPLPTSQWPQAISEFVLEPFFKDLPDADQELRQIREGLSRWESNAAGIDTPMDLPAALELLSAFIKDGVPARGFLGYGITFASLTPMRAIPHKVVALLGMQDGAFPRDPRRPVFDLMGNPQQARPGDRAALQSDRFLFLETLLSARKYLHVSFCGFSPHEDTSAPPAVPVDELRRFLETSAPADLPRAGHLHSPFVVEHRLQAHHPDYFQADHPANHLRSYSRSAFEAASIRPHPGTVGQPAPAGVLPSTESRSPLTVSAQQLLEFFHNPAKAFAEQSLGITVPWLEQELPDSEPLEIDALTRFRLRQAALANQLQDTPGRTEASVALPPGDYGAWLAHEIEEESVNRAHQITENFPEFKQPADPPFPIAIDLIAEDKAVHVCGFIHHLHQGQFLRFRPGSKAKASDQLSTWIQHLLLCAAAQQQESIFVPWDIENAVRFPPLEPDTARSYLQQLLSCYLAGMRQPLPFIPECSRAFAANVDNPNRAWEQAEAQWSPREPSSPPSKDPWVLLCWHHRPPFAFPYAEAFAATAQMVFSPLLQNLAD